jgi:hypothetical protein
MVASWRVKIAISAGLIGFLRALNSGLGFLRDRLWIDALLAQLRAGHGLGGGIDLPLGLASVLVGAAPNKASLVAVVAMVPLSL